MIECLSTLSAIHALLHAYLACITTGVLCMWITSGVKQVTVLCKTYVRYMEKVQIDMACIS